MRHAVTVIVITSCGDIVTPLPSLNHGHRIEPRERPGKGAHTGADDGHGYGEGEQPRRRTVEINAYARGRIDARLSIEQTGHAERSANEPSRTGDACTFLQGTGLDHHR